MFSYQVEDYFVNVPQTVFPQGAGPFKGIACHWTVGGTGRAGAISTVNYFLANPQLNASYHELWWWKDKTFGVLRIVRPNRAAHSMNPAAFNPNANAIRIMGSKVWDANRYAYAVSFCGADAELNAAMADPDFIAAAARRVSELITQFPSLTENPLFTHADIQPPPNKVDWGTVFTPKIYTALGAEGETDMQMLPSSRTLMTGRINTATGIATLPLFDAPLLTSVNAGTWIGIVHEMPDQGGYTIDGVVGNDWLAVDVGLTVGYIERPYVDSIHLSDAGQLLIPPAPAPDTDCDEEVATAVAPLNAEIDRLEEKITRAVAELS